MIIEIIDNMKKIMIFILMMTIVQLQVRPQDIQSVKPVKNVILLIPDGTSLSTVSMARWLQWYTQPDRPKLNMDPYLCGTVRTHSSNAPIGDSAPTTSCYMTGQTSRTGYIATYPDSDPVNDIYPTDSTRAFQPLTTILEAVKMTMGKAVGLVVTCEFPHATPADCSAHCYNRNKYEWIVPQMVHNDLDVVIGGGTSLLSKEDEEYLKESGCEVLKNDLEGMINCKNDRMWALYGEKDMDYDLDRDSLRQPSLEEMTRTAIEKLSQDPDGFLMVEGSKIDWAAHANDPVGMATDFLAYDRACGVALDFARRNGETAVVMVPDHGNSGISIGRSDCIGYDRLSKKQLFHQLSLYRLTAEGFAREVNRRPYTEVQNLFREKAGFELTQEELDALNHCRDYKNSIIPQEQRLSGTKKSLYSGSLTTFMSQLLTAHTCFGFTTDGHTGEEVFLAVYHPDRMSIPMGMLTNIELSHYLCSLFGMTHDALEFLTAQNFAPHTEVFKEFEHKIIPSAHGKDFPILVVKNGKRQLYITPFSNIVALDKNKRKSVRLHSVVVYVDKTNTFYLPVELTKWLK